MTNSAIGTVLPAKSYSDVMFCYKIIRNLESIDHLCISPILRIGLIYKGDLKKKMQQKSDIGGQISKLLYHYIFLHYPNQGTSKFQKKYWLKNKI